MEPKKSARVPESIDVKSLKGVVVDDKDASRTGTWSESSSIGPFVGEGYLHDGNEQKGKLSAQFAYQANHAGLINIRLAYTANQNRATNTPIAITVGQKQTKLTIINASHPTEATFGTTWVDSLFPPATGCWSKSATGGPMGMSSSMPSNSNRWHRSASTHLSFHLAGPTPCQCTSIVGDLNRPDRVRGF